MQWFSSKESRLWEKLIVFGLMDGKRWAFWCLNLKILLGFLLILSDGANPGDVDAIYTLYAALGSPPLPGWGVDVDPCNGKWQGVVCEDTNIVSITINSANLGGELGDKLGAFSSIKTIDFSNNRIGGAIPSNLPVTLQSLFLSANEFTGSIPDSLSSVSQLSAISLNDNNLAGEIPDSFQGLVHLANLDLSNNNLSGVLPSSLGNLSLMTLHLQNNQLSGTLDVLQNLPLRDLNIENNLFSGLIPQKLLDIPVFRNGGNPFSSIISAPFPPSSSSTTPSPALPFFGPPTSGKLPPITERRPGNQTDGPSFAGESNSNSSKRPSAKRIVWISITVVWSFIILVLAALLCLPKCLREMQETCRGPKQHELAPYMRPRDNPGDNDSLVQPGHDKEKAPLVLKPNEDYQPRKPASIQKDSHVISLSRLDIDFMLPPPPPPTEERVIMKHPKSSLLPTSVKSFTVASLQQYTNSFSQDNLVGAGTLGTVYKAELPDGRLFAVKKLDNRVSNQLKDNEFVDLVNNIHKIHHANVVEITGYCVEHGQRLLIHEYYSNGTLQDALHSNNDEFKKTLSWNVRIRMALEAARALEYLHEVCEPPVIHRNFKSANVLLDDELGVHISDCGLAPLISSATINQLSGQLLGSYGYGAPEVESGIYTSKSDVYSFGVVMLELITGRMSYDRTRRRGEQLLVRWAIPQLHDIDALTRMADPSLGGKYSVKSLSHFADIISRCIQPEPEFRPPMSEVVQDIVQMMMRRDSQSPNRFEDE
ncbi:PREDICTED: protein STRUBBELIG-RECEPTOR FAMILY 3-like [Ipomoea nil]|uniref:protein STRUBBELIG-RECEPTOR FAMILY 3-like n=1 Tax=Ipomoea nil TaxID=35883 RepID=UPI0009016EBC|nr:PREDICTED: protein STRUBBELIG-RECEPTOR FAMILY 3-like [Ipomoea nil]XP_019172103.1 PREDICTED: protein STRUBBELIG-RECEPTOR FAMILY 3-like [Ipomoea nil]XP_019172107.1 PREDICTED: protein STRUBBELIG-RECEPTOR FAMILY 3-like [Ipomoea nil]XP_019172111.1 PREDICTED: protein STRUBBELIG-RECEPTOR FAMILY 3-like [Ipomoea nil]XP_019172115.1 PREDICTED: protein STRUBBELIG-RECEPTOR FAMILY 3-like [Ipomoea nil]XP_019172122.1 PREDICTED: protein STRUBBELIG-RECEPTOR FAMILY 3-like [Ipomoea nil]